MAEIFIKTAETFHHDAIFLHPNPGTIEETIRLIDIVREISGNKYFLMIHGDATFGIPSGEKMMEFVQRIADEPEKLKKEAEEMVNKALERGEILKEKNIS